MVRFWTILVRARLFSFVISVFRERCRFCILIYHLRRKDPWSFRTISCVMSLLMAQVAFHVAAVTTAVCCPWLGDTAGTGRRLPRAFITVIRCITAWAAIFRLRTATVRICLLLLEIPCSVISTGSLNEPNHA